MALIVEDGSIVANANSYASADTIVTTALAEFGSVLVDSATLEIQIRAGMRYLESMQFKGVKVDADTQPLLWPRSEVYVNEALLDSESIPSALVLALTYLTKYQVEGSELFAEDKRNLQGVVTSQAVETLRRTFSSRTGVGGLTGGLQGSQSELSTILAPLLLTTTGLRTVRI